jgi:hypothetical protein
MYRSQYTLNRSSSPAGRMTWNNFEFSPRIHSLWRGTQHQHITWPHLQHGRLSASWRTWELDDRKIILIYEQLIGSGIGEPFVVTRRRACDPDRIIRALREESKAPSILPRRSGVVKPAENRSLLFVNVPWRVKSRICALTCGYPVFTSSGNSATLRDLGILMDR